MIPLQRDLAQTQSTMQRWLEVNYPVGHNLTVGELEGFAQGFSGEILTFDLTYQQDGVERTEGLVLRIEPSEKYQLFLDTNFEGQYRVMESLCRHTSVPVPPTIGFESDLSHLGARFYVMARSSGNTGQLGLDWMYQIGNEGLEKTWWNGLAAMAEMHRADPKALGLEFLDQPSRGADPLDQQLQYYWEYYCWVRGGEKHPVIEAAYEWLHREKPMDLPPTGIVWGDAKRGNQLFDQDLQCSAVLDFEMACLGPAELDLGWWLEGEYQTAEGLGMVAPPGIPETIARYGEMLGREVTNIEYYIVFAAFRIAVLRVKLWELREGQPYRGGPRDGDVRLATVLKKYTGIQPPVYAWPQPARADSGEPRRAAAHDRVREGNGSTVSLLTRYDDLFVHQSQNLLARPATTDGRFFERSYFNIHDQRGEFSLCVGLGCYPNLNTMDGFGVGITKSDTQQHNARFFRELHGDPTDLHVGALELEIIDPMQRWLLRMEPNGYDIDFELEMQARFPPWDTRLHAVHEDVLVFDYATFVQSVSYRGRVRIGERTFEGDFSGCRDRSFGLRPVGGIPMPAGAGRPFGLHYWLNPQFEDSAFFVLYTETNDGRQLSIDGGIAGGKYDGRRFVSLEHDLSMRDGIRIHEKGVFRLTDDAGHVHELQTEAALPGVYLLGGGYFVSQGKPLGDHQEGDKYDVTSGDPAVLSQYLADWGADQPALYTLAETGEQAYGVLEFQLGPDHKKYPSNAFH